MNPKLLLSLEGSNDYLSTSVTPLRPEPVEGNENWKESIRNQCEIIVHMGEVRIGRERVEKFAMRFTVDQFSFKFEEVLTPQGPMSFLKPSLKWEGIHEGNPQGTPLLFSVYDVPVPESIQDCQEGRTGEYFLEFFQNSVAYFDYYSAQ